MDAPEPWPDPPPAPETPDFEELVKTHLPVALGPRDEDIAVELLRQVWNARGAADANAVEAALVRDGGGCEFACEQAADDAIRRLNVSVSVRD